LFLSISSRLHTSSQRRRFVSCGPPGRSADDYRSWVSWMSAFYSSNSRYLQILFIIWYSTS
jgi:hypothetical protein